jgi:hypothetical protein
MIITYASIILLITILINDSTGVQAFSFNSPITNRLRSTGVQCFSSNKSSQEGPRSAEQRSKKPRPSDSRSSGPRSGPLSIGRQERNRRNRDITSTGPPRDTLPRGRSQRDGEERRRRNPKIEVEAFDPKKLTSLQISNENADPLDLSSSASSVCMRVDIEPMPTPMSQPESKSDIFLTGKPINHAHFDQLSLDDLFPNLGFSNRFCTDGTFRQEIRHAMRQDIFYTTPAYSSLSPKVAAYMLDDDSSLQGSWNCIPSNKDMEEIPTIRMTRLTSVLKKNLGAEAPNGDEFLMKIGGLCGVNPSNHWIDIIGVKDRKISHSWHQDTGISCSDADDSSNLEKSRFTIMLGFPMEDEYEGTGVFSHSIKLTEEHLAPKGHSINEPILFEGSVDEQYIVRPLFTSGKEILRYRDVDTLHSAPDVVYRKSVMRFM